jgi:multidrug resistance efflux pump
VQALHARLQQLEATVARLRDSGHSIVAQRDAARAEAASLRLALGTAQQELSRVREHREYESLARSVLQHRPAAPPPSPEEASRFRAAKLAFARLYHPDRAAGSELDKAIRGQVFREFWAELERIEKG